MVPDPQSGCTQHMEPAVSGDVVPNEMASLASIAISLKRIADRLDHVTDYFGDRKAQLRVHANCDHRP